jgi:hypothetical protein
MLDEEPEELAWIKADLRPVEAVGDGNSNWWVGSRLPPGFDRYLRLFNRWEDGSGGWTTWKERAAGGGVIYHPELSEIAIGRVVSNRCSPTPWTHTAIGEVDQITLKALCPILDRRTRGRPVAMAFMLSEWVYGEEAVLVNHPLEGLVQGVYNTGRFAPRTRTRVPLATRTRLGRLHRLRFLVFIHCLRRRSRTMAHGLRRLGDSSHST